MKTAKKIVSLFCVLALFVSMLCVGASAKNSSAVIEVGKSATFSHSANYAQSSRLRFSYQWEITSGGNYAKITSGSNALTCTVVGLAPGTVVLTGAATRGAGRVAQRLTDTITITVNPRSYVMTFDPNGGSVSTTSVPIYNGCTLGRMPTPTRSGYTFMGWFNAKSGGTQFEEGDGITVTGDGNYVPMYAQWKQGSAVSPVKNTSPAANTALVTVDGKQYTFYLKNTSVTDGKDYCFTLYTLDSNSAFGKYIHLIIDHEQNMWETTSTNDADTKYRSLTIYYHDNATDAAEKCYYSSFASYEGSNVMTLDMKSDDGQHLEGTFSGDVKQLSRYGTGTHKISGSFSVTYGQTHAKTAGISAPRSSSSGSYVWDDDFDDFDDEPSPRRSSSSGSTYQENHDCLMCEGSGNCWHCDGKGLVKVNGKWVDCSVCYKGHCPRCAGSKHDPTY